MGIKENKIVDPLIKTELSASHIDYSKSIEAHNTGTGKELHERKLQRTLKQYDEANSWIDLFKRRITASRRPKNYYSLNGIIWAS